MNARALAIELGVALAIAGPCTAQTLHWTPELGWSELRGPVLGARLGLTVVGGLELAGQGLVLFPDEDVADADVDVRRSAWQLSGNVLYRFDPSRAISPYLGVGGRYGHSRILITVDGLRSRSERTGWERNLIIGASLPRLPSTPFVEWRASGGVWILTAGVRLGIRE